MSIPSSQAEEALTAPTFGQNGRNIILQAARALESQEPKQQQADAAQRPAAPQEPDFGDDAYYSALPSAARPSITYDPNAKIPRRNRQAGLNRLVAQHLRLAARTVPHQQKLAFVGKQEVWSAAVREATAQEAGLHKSAKGGKQVYQNLLARARASPCAAATAPSTHGSSSAAAQPADASAAATSDGILQPAAAGTTKFSLNVAPPAGEASTRECSTPAGPSTGQKSVAAQTANVKRKLSEMEATELV